MKLSADLNLFNYDAKTIIFNQTKSEKKNLNNYIKINFNNLTKNILKELHKQNIQSIIIEGGTKTLQSFIDKKIWDEARIFITNKTLTEGLKPPTIEGEIVSEDVTGGDIFKILYV